MFGLMNKKFSVSRNEQTIISCQIKLQSIWIVKNFAFFDYSQTNKNDGNVQRKMSIMILNINKKQQKSFLDNTFYRKIIIYKNK